MIKLVGNFQRNVFNTLIADAHNRHKQIKKVTFPNEQEYTSNHPFNEFTLNYLDNFFNKCLNNRKRMYKLTK